ncbi:MAG: hypothetical protein ACK5JJ_01915 [Cyanobacteriota bacterium]|jgi:hypothetical protein
MNAISLVPGALIRSLCACLLALLVCLGFGPAAQAATGIVDAVPQAPRSTLLPSIAQAELPGSGLPSGKSATDPTMTYSVLCPICVTGPNAGRRICPPRTCY